MVRIKAILQGVVDDVSLAVGIARIQNPSARSLGIRSGFPKSGR